MAMAKIIKPVLLLAGLLLQAQIALAAAPNFPPEVVDSKAVDAFKNYWNAFEAYEHDLLRDGEKEFSSSWERVKKSYQHDHAKLSAAELESLQKSAATYRSHLAAHENADNRPYVILNLAQILSLIGDHQAAEDPDAGTFARSEALALLKDLEDNYKAFSHREQAMYLRATLFSAMGRDDDALAAWQALATVAQSTLYGVYARIAVGDYMFKHERPADAMRAYQKALSLLPAVNADDPDYEKLRIDYRLGWAAYRAAELEVTISAASDLLAPATHARSTEQRLKIQQDAVELIGDALYENNIMEQSRAVLKRKELSEYSGAIGARTMARYSANGIYTAATELGEFLIQITPLAIDAPEILRLTADAWDKVGNADKRVQSLERLALLLPAQSLWRARHRGEQAAVKKMESDARKAGEAVAAAHYDTGLASGNAKAFLSAASFYEILIDFAANDPAANDWRLRRAHCQYFAGNVDDAAKLYTALKTDYKVDADTLQIASYQLVLTNEKRWREAYARALELGEDANKDRVTLANLGDMEKSIDEFAARFPGQSRAVDLLLVGASANRDMNRYAEASKYWQRVLVSQPAAAQRGIAVRGLILAAMKIGGPADVVDAARRYLKLEDWGAVGLTIGTELNGVLSAAAMEDAKLLTDAGKALEAGVLLVDIAEEFPSIPERDRIYRDGAYDLAIAGDWNAAQKAAEGYFSAGLTASKADMTYLLARAQEYQLRLHEAAKSYLILGQTYPKHTRSATSVVRAERLAVAEGDFALAAEAATIQAERAKTEKERLAHYTRAASYLEKDGNAATAVQIARKGQRASKTTAERFRAQLLVARLTYKSGSEQEALDDLTILAKQIDKSGGKMAPADLAALSGEAHVLLGEEARRQFEDFHLAERGSDLAANISLKSNYFANLSTEYDKAAAAGDPRWASEARFQIGNAAQTFADEIAGIPARRGEVVTLKAQSRYNSTIERLQALARKYFSTNVLNARKSPAQYRDNDWVKKSALRLTGETSDSPESKHKDMMPTAFQSNIPSEWSL